MNASVRLLKARDKRPLYKWPRAAELLMHSQHDEIERVACPGCGSFLRLEASLPERAGHPRYDVMRCVSCDVIQCVVDERFATGLVARAVQALTKLRATHNCSLCWPSQTISSSRPILNQ